jgi:hypothetical protein
VKHAKALETAARIGFAARGVVYLIVSALAVLAAIGAGGQVTGGTGALRTFLGEPFGWIWLWLIALGLFLFGAWQLWNGAADADSRGNSPNAIAARGGKLLSGLVYFGLAAYAINLAIGFAATSTGDSTEGWTAWLLAQPFGPWLVAAAGAGIAVAGIGFYWKAWSADFKQYLGGKAQARWWAVPLGRAGFVAQGIVFNLIGAFLILAGVQADPSEAEGLGGALRSLQAQPYGWILLGLTAVGLGCYGAFSLAQALHRRINVPNPRRWHRLL